jgi:hypothetical protein
LDRVDAVPETVGGGLGGILVVPIVQDDVGAIAVQHFDRGAADAAGGAGHQDGPSAQQAAHATAWAPVISMTEPQM